MVELTIQQGEAQPKKVRGNDGILYDPYEAARKIRTLARQLVDSAEQSQGYDEQKNLPGVVRVKTVREHLGSRATLLEANGEKARNNLSMLKSAAKGRKTSEIVFWATRVEGDVSRMSLVAQGLRYDQGKLRTFIEMQSKMPLPTSEQMSPSFYKIADDISRLSQALPTVPTAPVTKVEQTLRAIATILKINGFFDEKGKPIPYGESSSGAEEATATQAQQAEGTSL